MSKIFLLKKAKEKEVLHRKGFYKSVVWAARGWGSQSGYSLWRPSEREAQFLMVID